ncbi:MAG: hypothetical protein Q7T74_03205, partial [Candidatus Saccharibacteria bacterium]|nr:hypothetical protein [Candidatus Saccharibacteria bacterium]
FTLNATGGSGTDIAGANLTLAGGKGTGNAAGGSLIFSTSIAEASGATLQTLTERMRINESGLIGIGTSSPISELHITRALTQGATGKALAIFDQIESQDIFSASSSGVAKFTVSNSGGITAAGFTTNGGLLYTNASGVFAQTGAGSATQCLLGGTTPTFGSCSTGSVTSPFQELSGAIVPLNSTLDFLLGAQASTSAKFAVLNIAGGTPTASISAQNAGGQALVLGGDGSIQSVRNNTLTLGGDTTGNIVLAPLNGGGTTASVSIKNSSLLPTTDGSYEIGSSSLSWYGIHLSGNLNLYNGNTANPLPSSGAAIRMAAQSNIRWRNNSDTADLVIQPNTNDQLLMYNFSGYGFGSSNNPTGFFQIEGGNKGGNAALIANQVGASSNDIFSASSSVVAKFTVSNSGGITAAGFTTNGGLLYTNASGVFAQTGAGSASQCLLGGTTPTFGSCSTGSVTSPFQELSGAIVPNNTSLDFLLGSQSSASAKFAVLNINSGTPTASISAGTSGALYLSANGSLQTTAFQTLTIGGSTTGNVAINPKA